MIEIPDSSAREIRRHGRAAYGDEACGAMYGHVTSGGKSVVRVAPMRNARGEERHRRFVVSPEDYRRAEADAMQHAMTLLGFYHSHPDHPAFPSDYDLAHAFPFFSYVILSVENAEPGEMRSFVLADDRSEFLEEAIQRKE